MSDENFEVVPHRALEAATLRNIIEHFVNREGTDYGTVERSLDDKVRDIERQLDKGEVVLVFNHDDETVTIVPKRAVRR